jgi:radical SAM superfamily enzyme YgiQ (UPF0313 family)
VNIALCSSFGPSEEQAKLSENLAIEYLGAALRREGFSDVTLLNPVVDPHLRYERLTGSDDAMAAASRIAASNPTLCGVSVVFRGQTDWARRFTDHLRQLRPDCHIIVGGMFPTSASAELLGEDPAMSLPSVDSVCVGEGDELICQLATALSSSSPWQEVPGLAHRSEVNSSDVRIAGGSPTRLTAEQVDGLPPLTHTLLPSVILGGGVVQVEASRGCDAGCLFCDARKTAWRPRSVSSIVDELGPIAHDYPGALIYFVDNIFLGFGDGDHLRRGQELARAIVRSGLDIRFVVQDRAANVDASTFAQLKTAGLASVYLGIESFSQRQLRRLGKGRDATPETNANAFRTLDALGIYTQFGFLPFDEGLQFDDLYETFGGLSSALSGLSRVHLSNVNEVIPYEGTHLARLYERSYGQKPDISFPWAYEDPRVWRARHWIWQMSVTLWPLTSTIFNLIQDEEFQRFAHQTIPTKNRGFLEYCLAVLDRIDEGSPDDLMYEAYADSVAALGSAIEETLELWEPCRSRALATAALRTIVTAPPEACVYKEPAISRRNVQVKIRTQDDSQTSPST